MRTLLGAFIIIVTMLNVAVAGFEVDEHGAPVSSCNEVISLSVNHGDLDALQASEDHASHDSAKEQGHACHLGHCSFVVRSAFVVGQPTFQVSRPQQFEQELSGSYFAQINRPPLA